jgi:hypothetical protein
MKSNLWFLVVAPALVGGVGWGAAGFPDPVDPAEVNLSPYAYTGLVETPDSTGSGAVAIHPRLVLGCAHVNFTEANTWHPQGAIRWFWKWNQGTYPEDAEGVPLTGYYYFAQYRANVLRHGVSDQRTFAVDFVANYSATRDLAEGTAARWVEDGKKALTTGGLSKLISGYPVGRYPEGDPDEYRMHSTEFAGNMEVDRDNHLGLDGVETGGGNSGGPVWVWDGTEWGLAGVLVSGLEAEADGWSSIGVCALNSGAWAVIRSALDQTGSANIVFRKSCSLAGVPARVADQSSVSRSFTATGLVGVIQGLKISLGVTHQRQGDLIITLRSPSGKTVTLLSAVAKNKSSRANLTWSGRAVSGFAKLPANGTWTLTVRDSYRRDTGSVVSGSLEITTR